MNYVKPILGRYVSYLNPKHRDQIRPNLEPNHDIPVVLSAKISEVAKLLLYHYYHIMLDDTEKKKKSK